MKKLASVLLVLVMLMSMMTFTVSSANAPGEDPTPENVGVLITKSGIDVSYVSQFVDGDGNPFLAGGGVGAHGGHETRIVRTPNGTYATYITNATGQPDDAHPNWYNGVATFDVIKITATGFESIHQGIYPQAAGSCTPNILFDGDHTVYVTIIADDKDRYGSTAGTGEFTNGIWLEVIEIDTNTDKVSYHAGPAFYDHTTTPFEDHGYGYSQPCLDVAHGKLFMITNGGEAEDPDYTGYGRQAGYMAWWVYDLNTHTWDPACRTIRFFSRRCYMNVYPDGNGGFTMVTERCAPSAELGKAIGCTFSTSGYLWDALYVMHIADPLNDCYIGQEAPSIYDESTIYEWTPDRDTVIWEPTYVAGARNNIANASHYGTGGCTYLDDQNRMHVIYSIQYYNPSTSKTKVAGAYHAIYDLSGNELYKELIPTSLLANNGTKSYKGPDGFAMTQGANGDYYVFLIRSTSSGTTLEIWTSPHGDGINFTKKASSISLKDKDGNAIAGGTKPIIGNTRNGSVLDGTVALMFHTSGSGGDPYYYFSVKVDEPAAHTHSYTATVVAPTCTEQGYTKWTCSCGDTYNTDYTDALGHNAGGIVIENEVTETCTVGHYWEEVTYCTRCQTELSREQKSTDAPGHNYVGTVTAPTCTEQGYTTYVCSRCSDSYVDDYTDALGHLWDDGVVTIPAGLGVDGVMTYTCTRCRQTREEVIPALSHIPGDITGEGSVGVQDIVRLLKYVSGEDVDVNVDALDLNGDGVVNVKDIIRLMKYLAGEPVEIF